jgi:hypothetical protein
VSVEDGIPETGQATEAPHDWEKDYKALQAEYTRSQQALKDEQAAWDDEQALLARIAEKHPNMIAAEEEPEPEIEYDEDEAPLTRAEFTKWQAEQKAEREQQESSRQFNADLERFVGERELSPQGQAWINEQARQGKVKGPDDLEKAVQSYFEWEDGLRGPRAKPNAPHVLKGGKAASETPDFSQMSQDQVNEYMAERAKALMS